MKITTTYKNVNGTPKVLARCAGKQKTVNWDLSKSTEWNHGTAAGALLSGMERDVQVLATRSIDTGRASHDSNDAGTIHLFKI